jgi:hypothetical protein
MQIPRVIWAVYGHDDLIADVLSIIKQHHELHDNGEILWEHADLSRPRIPNSLIIVGDKFPINAFLRDWKRYNVPYTCIQLKDLIPMV